MNKDELLNIIGKCPHCNAKIEPNWDFCPFCTKPVTSEIMKRLFRQSLLFRCTFISIVIFAILLIVNMFSPLFIDKILSSKREEAKVKIMSEYSNITHPAGVQEFSSSLRGKSSGVFFGFDTYIQKGFYYSENSAEIRKYYEQQLLAKGWLKREKEPHYKDYYEKGGDEGYYFEVNFNPDYKINEPKYKKPPDTIKTYYLISMEYKNKVSYFR